MGVSVNSIPSMPSPRRDLHFMGNPSLWISWPFLPLGRWVSAHELQLGVLIDTSAYPSLTGYRCTVFRANLYATPRSVEQLLKLPRETFDTFEELVAAGWRVD
jgi:hypothetical protein